MSSSPAVVIKSKFVVSNDSKSGDSFNDYINYMDRAETKESDYEHYNDYMSNEEKSTGLFTNNEDNLTKEEKEKYKDIFKNSQDNGSILWQDVISFDNDWLKEIGVIEDNKINEEKLKNVTRETMNEMMENENIYDSAVWTGAIHYNTDNIHIHTATVQTHNFKERGKRKPKTLTKMKSNVLNKLVDRTKENEKINSFIRDKLVDSKKKNPIPTLKNKLVNKDMVKQFNHIYNSLPEDKRKWKYNMNSMKEIRPEIDKLTDMYIEKNFKEEFNSFKGQVDKNVEFYKKTYGNNSQAKEYEDNVYKDMYSRMGNTILTEIREVDKKNNQRESPTFSSKKALQNKFKMKRDIGNGVYKLDGYMKDELQNMKNQQEFQKLEMESEMER